jgi:hypothetical protein
VISLLSQYVTLAPNQAIDARLGQYATTGAAGSPYATQQSFATSSSSAAQPFGYVGGTQPAGYAYNAYASAVNDI